MNLWFDKIPRIPTNWSAAASAVFLILTLSNLRILLGEKPQDVARKAKILVDEHVTVIGPLNILDWTELDDLLMKRRNAVYSLALFIIGAILSLLYLLFPADEQPSNLASRLIALAIDLAVATGAWMVAALSRDWWHKHRRPRWIAYVWLAWLESEVPRPLAEWGTIADDPIAVIMTCPHPELDRFLSERHVERSPTITQSRRDVEAWLHALVARWKYHFVEPDWERWRTDSTQSFTAQ